MITLAAFVLASSTFHSGGTMPFSTVSKACGGQNISPELHWRGAPARTKSFALIVHDPDAPAPGGWYHWVVYNLPATTQELPASAMLASSQLGRASSEQIAYGGPCPPSGPVHHYNFTLYALDEPVVMGAALTGPELVKAIAPHVLATAKLTGLYRR